MEALPGPRLPADLHLRPLPAGRRASRAGRAGRLGRVERHRLLQLGAGRPNGALRRLHRYRLRHRRARAGRGPAPDRCPPGRARPATRAATSRPRCWTRTRSTRCWASCSGRRAGSRVAALDGLPAGALARSGSRPRRGRRLVRRGGHVPRGRFHARGPHPRRGAAGPAAGARWSNTAWPSCAPPVTRWSAQRAQRPGAPIGAVSLGTPHASLAELRQIARRAGGRSGQRRGGAAGLDLARHPGRGAEREGVARRLRDAGAELLVDTCSYLGPILRPTPLPVMTDSGKWAWYAPANIGARVVFASRRECLRSAVAGRLWRDDAPWTASMKGSRPGPRHARRRVRLCSTSRSRCGAGWTRRRGRVIDPHHPQRRCRPVRPGAGHASGARLVVILIGPGGGGSQPATLPPRSCWASRT